MSAVAMSIRHAALVATLATPFIAASASAQQGFFRPHSRAKAQAAAKINSLLQDALAARGDERKNKIREAIARLLK